VGGKKYQVVTFLGDNKAKVITSTNRISSSGRDLIDNCFSATCRCADLQRLRGRRRREVLMHIVQKQGGHRSSI
jgi:hypothetical protein